MTNSVQSTQAPVDRTQSDKERPKLFSGPMVRYGRHESSGYRIEIYNDLAWNHGWRRVDFDLPNNASSKQVKESKTERVWMNHDENGARQ